MNDLFLNPSTDRRAFLGKIGMGILTASVIGSLESCAGVSAQQNASKKNTSDPETRKMVPFPQKSLDAPSEKEDEKFPEPLNPQKRLGYALVGLGNLTLGQLLPAFASCKYSKAVALVSGDSKKAEKVADQYGIKKENIYNYDNFDNIRNNDEIDVVYIVLPNSMHHEFTIRAAKAGKHVLCEKPMANSVQECEEMVNECNRNNRKLMIAYRVQYEPHHLLAMQWTREQKFGRAKLIESYNGHNIGDPRQWRLKKNMAGGGALVDIGIYCLNTSRFLLGEEPHEVLATMYSTPRDERFTEVEETMMFQLHFPSGAQVNGITSYGAHQCRKYRIYADKGAWYGMDPAFDYQELRMEVSQADGKLEWKSHPAMGEKNQFALEIDHMSQCVIQDKKPFTPGEEGLQDQRIMEALYRSAGEKKSIALEKYTGVDLFRGTKPEK